MSDTTLFVALALPACALVGVALTTVPAAVAVGTGLAAPSLLPAAVTAGAVWGGLSAPAGLAAGRMFAQGGAR